MGGYVLMHRGWRDNPVFSNVEYSKCDAWGWLIEAAAFQATRVRVNGAYLNLARGQLSYSIRFMAERWKWSKSRVERFIHELKTETMIETDNGTGQLIVTICNYDLYQLPGSEHETATETETETRAGHERDTSGTNNNELKYIKTNTRSKKRPSGEEHQDFPAFWLAMPKRGSAPNPRSRASKNFNRLIAEGITPSDLIAAARNYAAACDKEHTRPNYVQQAATFLGPENETWKQYLAPEVQSSDPPSKLAYRAAYVKWDEDGRQGTKPNIGDFAHLDRGAA